MDSFPKSYLNTASCNKSEVPLQCYVHRHNQVLRRFDPVSYTHLDVYKRQIPAYMKYHPEPAKKTKSEKLKKLEKVFNFGGQTEDTVEQEENKQHKLDFLDVEIDSSEVTTPPVIRVDQPEQAAVTQANISVSYTHLHMSILRMKTILISLMIHSKTVMTHKWIKFKRWDLC